MLRHAAIHARHLPDVSCIIRVIAFINLARSALQNSIPLHRPSSIMEPREEVSLDDAAAAMGFSKDELQHRLMSILGGFCPVTVPDALACLKAKRAAIPSYKSGEARDGRFEAVDSILIPLLEVRRAVPISPLSAMEPITLSAEAFDVLMTDIKEEDFSTIGMDLGVERLSLALSDGPFPVAGTIFGANHRIFVPLTVRHTRGCAVNVLFLLDTGAPTSFLRRDTLAALGYTDTVPSTANVYIQGVKVAVGVSHGHFANVDLLGQDVMIRMGAKLMVDYAELRCSIQGAAVPACVEAPARGGAGADISGGAETSGK